MQILCKLIELNLLLVCTVAIPLFASLGFPTNLHIRLHVCKFNTEFALNLRIGKLDANLYTNLQAFCTRTFIKFATGWFAINLQRVYTQANLMVCIALHRCNFMQTKSLTCFLPIGLLMQIFVANFDKILRKVCKAQFIKFASG